MNLQVIASPQNTVAVVAVRSTSQVQADVVAVEGDRVRGQGDAAAAGVTDGYAQSSKSAEPAENRRPAWPSQLISTAGAPSAV